jgi:hypothetical protein
MHLADSMPLDQKITRGVQETGVQVVARLQHSHLSDLPLRYWPPLQLNIRFEQRS